MMKMLDRNSLLNGEELNEAISSIRAERLPMTRQLSNKIKKHLSRLLEGGFGAEEFSRPGAFPDFDEYRQQGNYYVTKEEPNLLRRHADVCASLVKNELTDRGKPLKVTIVSRGPGSAFKDKEGILIEAFLRAGIDIGKVVLIDKSLDALKTSARHVREILPNLQEADIQEVCSNIFNPRTSEKYTLAPDTVEVGMCFGLTPANIDGIKPGETPDKLFEKQLAGIRGQMLQGAFFFASYDHNPDPLSCEQAYEGRDIMVKGFFREVFGISCTNGINYIRQHDINTGLTRHIADFTKRKAVDLYDGMRWIPEGMKLCFNLSYKPSKDTAIAANRNAGFQYPNLHTHPEFEDLVLMAADRKRLGLHPCIAA